MAAVSLVSNQCFITLKHVDNTIKSNLDITPLTTGKRPIDPHYPSCLETYSNLVQDSCSVELGRVPLFVEGPRLPDPEVRTIHRNLAPAAIVIDEPIFPFYLRWRWFRFKVRVVGFVIVEEEASDNSTFMVEDSFQSRLIVHR
jgi:hypothetical protein